MVKNRINRFMINALISYILTFGNNIAIAGQYSEAAEATVWNKEFARLNNIPFNGKIDQIGQKNYFLTIYRNNVNAGGSYFKLPGEVTAPQVTPVNPTEHTCKCDK